MSSITLHTSSMHSVFNELDGIGLILGLSRLTGETNRAYKQRLLDVMVHRSGSHYLGLVYGITRELGLTIQPAITLSIVKSGDDYVATEPVIIMKDSVLTVYDNYSAGSIQASINCSDINVTGYEVGDLIDIINATGIFAATLAESAAGIRSSTIFDQTSVKTVTDENIQVHGTHIALDNAHVISNSLNLSSKRLVRRVASEGAITEPGDYFLSPASGNIITNRSPGYSDLAFYKYVEDTVSLYWSPIILRSLQSDTTRRLMFDQMEDENGDPIDGLPSHFGADIINELMSVFHAGWGK